jgi:hypothetical protein
MLDPASRTLLAVILIACAFHFLLFPSSEQRFFSWAFLITGVLFIRSLPPFRLYSS